VVVQLFAIEYATLFDLINPGLCALNLPIPLGGSSNHFCVRSLVGVGAWDEWNVTEDADLGIRLARFGYQVRALDSDTWEEAPYELGNWFRQRVRWQKGWMRLVKKKPPPRNRKGLGPNCKNDRRSSQRGRNKFFRSRDLPLQPSPADSCGRYSLRGAGCAATIGQGTRRASRECKGEWLALNQGSSPCAPTIEINDLDQI
jgi:cellulose synthase/poly-beta-1,6-N-acetylglucosamine synthase-like glycosyltransferase